MLVHRIEATLTFNDPDFVPYGVRILHPMSTRGSPR
jgi:hypothetical protein